MDIFQKQKLSGMKTLKTTLGIFSLLMILSLSALAVESNAIRKAKEAVAAEPSDWKVLAKSAKICFNKNENTSEALNWINRSIEIKKTPENLEIKADYLLSQNQKREALLLYTEAVSVGRSANIHFDSSKLQAKIWELR